MRATMNRWSSNTSTFARWCTCTTSSRASGCRPNISPIRVMTSVSRRPTTSIQVAPSGNSNCGNCSSVGSGSSTNVPLLQAIEEGRLQESDLDLAVSNILGIMVKTWSFAGEPIPPLDRHGSVKVARAVAEQGSVLLKNRDGALPLVNKGPLAVLGENAVNPYSTGGGSAGIASPYKVSLLEGLQDRFGHEQVHFGVIPADAVAAIVI